MVLNNSTTSYSSFLSWANSLGFQTQSNLGPRHADRPVPVRSDSRRQPVVGDRPEHVPAVRRRADQRDCRLASGYADDDRRHFHARRGRPDAGRQQCGLSGRRGRDPRRRGRAIAAGRRQQPQQRDPVRRLVLGTAARAIVAQRQRHLHLYAGARLLRRRPVHLSDLRHHRRHGAGHGHGKRHGALAAVNHSYALDSTSTLTVLAPGVLANDTLPGETVSISTSQPQYGTLLMRSDGSFDYTPQAGYAGHDSFTYTITDSGGDTSTATVSADSPERGAGRGRRPRRQRPFRIWRSPGDAATINAMCRERRRRTRL